MHIALQSYQARDRFILVLALLLAIVCCPHGLKAQDTEVYTSSNGDRYHYILNDDGLSATITLYEPAESPALDIEIPQYIDGLLVTHIGEAAFFNSGLSGGLVIPSGVRSIDLDAFTANHGLTSVTIPASVNYIHPDAFTACDGVTDVYLHHIYPDIVEPPLYHELDWATSTDATPFAGPDGTVIHVMEGTIDAHQRGAVLEHTTMVQDWLSQNGASVVDDIEKPKTVTISINKKQMPCTSFFSTTAFIVPRGITCCVVLWPDIDTTEPNGGLEPWDENNVWEFHHETCTKKYHAGDTVPMGTAVLVGGPRDSEFTATLVYGYDATVPFRNLLHGRDFPCVADWPSYPDDAKSIYRMEVLEDGPRYGMVWEEHVNHYNEFDQWRQADGAPFVADGHEVWLSLTGDPDEGSLWEPVDSHYFIQLGEDVLTGLTEPRADRGVDGDQLWFDLYGRQLPARPTVPGIYIVRQGTLTRKLAIR